MAADRASWVLLLIFVMSFPVRGQTPEIPRGKTVKPSKEFIGEETKPFKYWPTDLPFWNEFNSYLDQKNYFSALARASKQVADFGESGAEGSEARVAAGIALEKLNFSYAAFLLFLDVAQGSIGTNPGAMALFQLGELTKKYDYDHEALEHLLVANDFSDLHPDILSFVSYHKALYNLRFGFNDWAKIHYGRIKEDSHWDHLFKYWSAVGEIARGKTESAKGIFATLKEKEKLSPQLGELVTLQVARLDFEEGNFNEAFRAYSSLKHQGLREWGRIQLERAWTKYYNKDYSKAMGILTALRAPIFAPSMNFERYILEMIIFKELCHYEAVEDVAKRFKKTFDSSLRAIKRRRPLRHDRWLFSMAVMNKDVQSEANLIDKLRKERKRLEGFGWAYFFVEPTLEKYELTDRRLQIRLDQKLEDEARKVADELLDADEQITFIEYTSRLDKLRVVRQGEERDYLPEKVTYLTFETIFWPVSLDPATSEFWTQELDHYKMLISSRCGQLNSPIPLDDEQESPEELEEEFR